MPECGGSRFIDQARLSLAFAGQVEVRPPPRGPVPSRLQRQQRVPCGVHARIDGDQPRFPCTRLPTLRSRRLFGLYAVERRAFSVLQFRVVASTFSFRSKKPLDNLVLPYPFGQNR